MKPAPVVAPAVVVVTVVEVPVGVVVVVEVVPLLPTFPVQTAPVGQLCFAVSDYSIRPVLDCASKQVSSLPGDCPGLVG